jgi:hypothetical protein
LIIISFIGFGGRSSHDQSVMGELASETFPSLTRRCWETGMEIVNVTRLAVCSGAEGEILP